MQVIYKLEEQYYYVVKVMILISFCKPELKYKILYSKINWQLNKNFIKNIRPYFPKGINYIITFINSSINSFVIK